MIAKRSRSTSRCRSLLAAALLCAALQASAGEKLLALAVTVNGAPGGTWALLERDGRLYAPLGAFKEWRLSAEHAGPALEVRGRTWRDLTPIPGYAAQFNLADQAVALSFAASQFQRTQFGRGYQRAQLGAVLPAAWVNYDLSAQSVDPQGLAAQRSLGALTELGWSNPAGVLTHTMVGRELDAHGAWTRLESAFRVDAPARNLTLIAGDSSTRPGMWGRQVYFGGLQIGRNFSLSPGLATYPQPLLAGESAAPSVLELYVDDILRRTEQIPAGPFAMDSLPTLTGTGQVRVVVRDQLGREIVLSDDFHATASLLAQGMSDYAVQAGRVRDNLGITSNDYGAAFGAGLLRYGFTDQATVELRGEHSRARSNAGAGLGVALPGHLVAQAGLAVSRSVTAGAGKRAILELQRPTLRHGFSLRYERTSADWREIGADALRPRSITSARYTTRNGRWYAGLAAARIVRFDSEPFTTASANVTLRLGRASLTLTATRISGAVRADTVGLSLVLPLGANMLNSGIRARDGGNDAYVTASRNPGVGMGLGANATAGTLAGRDYAEANLSWHGEHALATAQGHAEGAFSAARLGLQGALVASDGTVFATRALRTSFAVIEARGLDDVGVRVQSAVTARTGADGKALVTNLMPYRENRIMLDANDVPLGAELDSIDRAAVPRARSGVKVLFPVRPGRAALLIITQADGAPVPIGASLAVGERVYVVGSRGRAFVTGLEPGSVGRVTWENRSCSVPIALPAGGLDEVPTVAVVCR